MKFPEKLWTLVNECTSGAIGWGDDDDETIFIDYTKFEKEFLGDNSDVFKTRKVISFIRQLNLYGFRKSRMFKDVHEFKNPYFVRGRKDLLSFIRRNLRYRLNSKMFKEKENRIPDYSETVSPPGSSGSIKYPLSPLQDWQLSPCSLGSAYYPMNSVYLGKSLFSREGSSSIQEGESDIQQKDENLSLGNLDMYRNIMFVPVPAQYGMYPGFLNLNLTMPFPMHQQYEIKNSSTSEE